MSELCERHVRKKVYHRRKVLKSGIINFKFSLLNLYSQIPSVLIEESEGLNLNSRGDERSDSLGKRTNHQLEREALN